MDLFDPIKEWHNRLPGENFLHYIEVVLAGVVAAIVLHAIIFQPWMS